MFDIDECIKQNDAQQEKLKEISNTLNIKSLEEKLATLEKETMNPDFWKDSDKSSKVSSEISDLKKKTSSFNSLNDDINTIKDMLDLLKEDNDEDLQKDVLKSLKEVDDKLDDLEISTLLSGKYDKNNKVTIINLKNLII